MRTSIPTLLLVLAFLVIAGTASSQANIELMKTDSPEQFIDTTLNDIETDGMSSVRTLFEELGFHNAQTETMISMFETIQGESDSRWTKNMGYTKNKGIMQQHYAYAYLGNNAVLFIRVDFNRVSEEEWALLNFTFHSDYRQVIAADFGFLE